jgi:hypothetical protein
MREKWKVVFQTKHWKRFGLITICVVLFCRSGPAQGLPATILAVELAHETIYIGDISDYSKLALDPNPTVPASGGTRRARTFSTVITIGDIVAVNRKPAKGTMVERTTFIALTPRPAPGEAIADTTRAGIYDFNFEFQQADGTPIGSIRSGGAGQGSPPPGAIKEIASGNHPILGGTGAFLGVRGYQGSPPGGSSNVDNARVVSFAEDPANRRLHGGGPGHHTLYLIPMFRPEIVITGGRPTVLHSDFSPVTASKPAMAGEILILRTTGLGPTRPGLEPGEQFPTESPEDVNSPVDVTVNGRLADVTRKIGWPGTSDNYRVDFRVPVGTAPGWATLQIAAAWIVGPEVRIRVR